MKSLRPLIVSGRRKQNIKITFIVPNIFWQFCETSAMKIPKLHTMNPSVPHMFHWMEWERQNCCHRRLHAGNEDHRLFGRGGQPSRHKPSPDECGRPLLGPDGIFRDRFAPLTLGASGANNPTLAGIFLWENGRSLQNLSMKGLACFFFQTKAHRFLTT